jgi:hypothetical protein
MRTVDDPAYNCWRKMRSRCNDPQNENYRYYGALGIKVCARWDSFSDFLDDMGPRPSAQHSIDRIDAESCYEPGNCRWATISEQNRNRRTVRKLKVGGAELIAADIAEIVGIDRSYVRKLAREGMTLEQVLAKFGFTAIPVSDLLL